ncbi:hypothetical protein BDN70DRAFT_898677 [Pholiota conissans]|uniref:Uncharacterized protein n=1 Tax=Pholiota conissans TaxID=109636 RepID=A0A9P6CPL3_9AGAR|nr:hypothetical protein BDN70DRAFT_898677 [Pholiota conissans]
MFPGQTRIHCLPHADAKNIVGVCVLVIYQVPGKKFNDSKRSWLVLWEAGVAIQLHLWTAAVYPSSLFYHFNIDIHDIKFVTTEGEERPTPQNSTPIGEGDDKGRGSLVYFNQASMYQSSETGCSTLKEAIRTQVHSGRLDKETTIQQAFSSLGEFIPLTQSST